MREIKFRAWDKVHSEMFDTFPPRYLDMKIPKDTKLMTMDMEVLAIGIDSDLYVLDECGNWEALDSREYELMQYTGLKDKNGVEIFERDICSDPNYKYPYEVKYVQDLYDDNGSLYAGWNVGIPEEGINESIYGPTVIGNIYENPELIAERK